MKKSLILFVIIVIFKISTYWNWFGADYFRLLFFDVGQGDSSLFITPAGQTILIDGGPDKKILRELGAVLPFWRRQIDLLIISHAHDDHIIGLIELIRRYKIKNILYNNLDFNAPALTSLIGSIKNNGDKLIEAKKGMVFNFDNNCSILILEATKEIKKNDNDYSIVTMFNCLDKKVLLGGDAGETIEKELLESGVNLKSDIFKISHHGSLSANSQKFLEAVNPEIAIVSVGANNKFNHPNTNILERLRQLAVDIYQTDKLGTIEFLANYKRIMLNNSYKKDKLFTP